jgi:Tfp pilus assembly protein PilX
MRENNKQKQGFALLLAVIAISVVLAVGLGIFGIIFREIKLSSLNRESQMAFYAADTGIECIYYWDLKMQTISTTTPSSINCVNQTRTAGGALISSFDLNFDNGSCARIVIDKSNPSLTKIESRGYNVDCNSSTNIKVERAVRATY